MKISWLRQVFCLICTAAILVSGCFLPQRREVPTQAQRQAQRDADNFKGQITVWHVNGWKTGGTGASTLLTQTLAELEKKNFGVYFVTEVLTEEEAASRMAQGEVPDILSVPGGMTIASEASWQMLDGEGLLPCYREAVGETGAFLPWMASDAVVMIRNTSLTACGVNAPQEDWTLEEFIALAEKLTYQTQGRNAQTVYGITSGEGRWPWLSLWNVKEEAQLPGNFTERQAWNQLVEGNVSMLVGGAWEMMTLAWRQKENRGPDLTVLPWPKDVPILRSVQWVGCRLSGDQKKDALCKEAVEQLLSEKVQKKVIEQANCLSVTEGEEKAYEPSQGRPILYAVAGRKVTISGTWSENCGWGRDQGVYLWNP